MIFFFLFFSSYVLTKLLPSPCTASAAKNATPQNEGEKCQCPSAPSRLRFLLFGPRKVEVVVGMGAELVSLVAGCGCCHVVRGVPGQLRSPWRERIQLCSSWCTQSAPGCFQQVQGGHPSQILAGSGLTAHLLLGFCNRLHE